MLDVRLFGNFKVSLDGHSMEIPSRPMQLLLAYLILNAGKAFRRELLAGLLWGESDVGNARHNLRQTLWRLGKTIGKHYFLTDKVSVGFNPQAAYGLDVAILQEKVAQQASTDQLIRSVSVYTDVLLPGFYEDWVLLEQERLQAVYEDRMGTLLDKLSGEARWRETREWAERWIARGRVPETAYRALMNAHAGLGDHLSVAAVYQRCVEALDEEVGVEPSSETKALFQRISSEQDSPELQSKATKSRPTVKLPLQPTPFIGRKKELRELAALLTDPAIRLVNIQGPGGIGKTRLAIEAARAQSAAFADGVYFVSLAPLDDANLIATSIASAINFSIHARDQRKKEHHNQQLLAYLRDKHMLLLLDNLEHLIAGLPLIADILQVGSAVNILTTSRERLSLRGETVYSVGSMPVPEISSKEAPESDETQDALQLFVKCAERVQPRFELASDNLNAVIRICQLVEGLPLGIELAAAWAGLLTAEEIATEIKASLDFLSSNYHDIPERQRSVRFVFESSWRRLTEIEQDLFQQLSVFRGGFSRQAAENTTGATLQILMALVNKSLVQPDYAGRYHIHELLRQFGSEKLREAGGTERTRDRHLEFFLQVAEEAEPNLLGSEQITWANQLELEHDNLRAALAWSRTAESTAELGLRLTAALANFWQWRGYFNEGRAHLAAALSSTEASKRTAARAKTLYEAGLLAYVQSDYPASGTLLEESLSIYRELGPASRLGLAHALLMLGDTETGVGNYSTALSALEEGLSIMRELEEERGIARALWKMGWCAGRQGGYEQASQYFSEALPFYRKIGDKDGLAMVLAGMGEVMLGQSEYEAATDLLEESLSLRRENSDIWGIAASSGTLAWVALRQGDLRKATTLLAESLHLRRELGDTGGVAWCLEKLAEIALTTAQPDSPPRRENDFWRAACLFGAAAGLREPTGSIIDLIDQPEYERHLAILREKLDKAAFNAAWAEGQAMSLEQAIVYALSEPGSSE